MSPSSVEDLEQAEQLLLLACRRSIPGQVIGPCVEMAWRLGCGDRLGARATRAFLEMTRVLEDGGRRTLKMNAPHVDELSMDERSLLELVCACQSDALTLAISLSRWLVCAPHHVSLVGTAASLASLMNEAGLTLCAPEVFRVDPVRVSQSAA